MPVCGTDTMFSLRGVRVVARLRRRHVAPRRRALGRDDVRDAAARHRAADQLVLAQRAPGRNTRFDVSGQDYFKQALRLAATTRGWSRRVRVARYLSRATRHARGRGTHADAARQGDAHFSSHLSSPPTETDLAISRVRRASPRASRRRWAASHRSRSRASRAACGWRGCLRG